MMKFHYWILGVLVWSFQPVVPPDNVRATVTTPRSIEVTWDQSPSTNITGYLISYATTASYTSGGSVMVTGHSITRVTLTNLEENTPYTITVQTDSSGTLSVNSDVVSVTTWTDVPDGPPCDITLMDTDPAMLSVMYRQPEAILRNGDVTGYVIRYTRVDSGVTETITISDSSNGFRISVIPGLVAFTSYSVEVAAVNVNGTGPFSDTMTGLSGQDRPTAPSSLIADTIQSRLVTLSWMPPDTPNGIIIQYEVQDVTSSVPSLLNVTDTLMGTIEQLSPSTMHTIQIRAHTRVGAGPFSSVLTLITLPEFPAAVAGITVQSISSSMLTINWMEPDVLNGVITHYTVFYLPVSGPYGPIMTSNRRKRQLAQAGEFAMDFTGTSGTLTNLNGSVTYRIQVSAIALYNGDVLFGDRSNAEMITTNEGIPTKPHGVISTDVTQSSISLTWQRPDPPNGLIINYTVSYNAIKMYFNQVTGQIETLLGNNSISVEVDTSVSLDLTNLRLGTEYQFTIVAYTSVGPGPEAMISVSTLPNDDIESNDNLSTGAAVAISIAVTLIIMLFIATLVSVIIISLYHKYWRYKPTRNIENSNRLPVDHATVNRECDPAYATMRLHTTSEEHEVEQDPAYVNPQMVIRENVEIECDPAYVVTK